MSKSVGDPGQESHNQNLKFNALHLKALKNARK